LATIGGVPKVVVCDNLKAEVTKPSRYEPGINRTYQDLAEHYGFVVLPARVRKPRDKAKVEVAVLIVQRFVLARLRNRRFFSLEELNVAIRECVSAIIGMVSAIDRKHCPLSIGTAAGTNREDESSRNRRVRHAVHHRRFHGGEDLQRVEAR